MGKRLIQQRRGKGSPTYTANSHNYFGKIAYPNTVGKTLRGEIQDIVNSVGHSAPLMVIEYEDGQMGLMPAPLGVYCGQEVVAGESAKVEIGNVLPVSKVPTGTTVSCLERIPLDGGKLLRTAGSSASVVGKEGEKVSMSMPSKRTMLLHPNCRVLIGAIAGSGRKNKPMLKAGNKYHAKKAKGKLGKWPIVRGIAMNAVDHKHGGTHSRNSPGGGKTSSTRSRHSPPGAKVGLISARRTGKRK